MSDRYLFMLAGTTAAVTSTTNWFANPPRRFTGYISSTTSMTITISDGGGKLLNGWRLYVYSTATAMVARGSVSSNTSANTDGTGTYTLTGGTITGSVGTPCIILACEATSAGAPTTTDNLIVTANSSLAQSVSITNATSNTKSGLSISSVIGLSGITDIVGSSKPVTISGAGTLTITGNVALASGNTINSAIKITGPSTLNIAGTLLSSLEIAAGASDTITMTSSLSLGTTMTMTSGTLSGSGYNINCTTYTQSGGTISLGSGIVTASGTSGTVVSITGGTRTGNLNLTLNASPSATTRTVSSTLSDVALTIVNGNTDTINFSPSFSGQSINASAFKGTLTGTISTLALPTIGAQTVVNSLVYSPQQNQTISQPTYSLGLNISSNVTVTLGSNLTLTSLSISNGTLNYANYNITVPVYTQSGGTVMQGTGISYVTSSATTVVNITGGTRTGAIYLNANASTGTRTINSTISGTAIYVPTGTDTISGPFTGSLVNLTGFSGKITGTFTVDNIIFGSTITTTGLSLVPTSSFTLSMPSSPIFTNLTLNPGITLTLGQNTTISNLFYNGGSLVETAGILTISQILRITSGQFVLNKDITITTLQMYGGSILYNGYKLNPTTSVVVDLGATYNLGHNTSTSNLTLKNGSILYNGYTFDATRVNLYTTWNLATNITLSDGLYLYSGAVINFGSYTVTSNTFETNIPYTIDPLKLIVTGDITVNATLTLAGNLSVSGAVNANGNNILYNGYTITSNTLATTGLLDFGIGFGHFITGNNLQDGSGAAYAGSGYITFIGAPTTGTRFITLNSGQAKIRITGGSDTVSIDGSGIFYIDTTGFTGILSTTSGLSILEGGTLILGTHSTISPFNVTIGNNCSIKSNTYIDSLYCSDYTANGPDLTNVYLIGDVFVQGSTSNAITINFNGYTLTTYTLSNAGYPYSLLNLANGKLKITSGNFNNGGGQDISQAPLSQVRITSSSSGTLELAGSTSNYFHCAGGIKGNWSNVTLAITSNVPTQIWHGESLSLANIIANGNNNISIGFKSNQAGAVTTLGLRDFSINNSSISKGGTSSSSMNYIGTNSVTVSNNTITDITVTPSGKWTANNSTGIGTVTGWNFVSIIVDKLYKGAKSRIQAYLGIRTDIQLYKGNKSIGWS